MTCNFRHAMSLRHTVVMFVDMEIEETVVMFVDMEIEET